MAHHGLYCSHVFVCAHRSSLQHLHFCVRFRCFSVSVWTNHSACGCLLAPQGGITLTARQFPLSTERSSTVTSWRELPVSCADVGLHTGVTWCSDFKLRVLPQFTHSAISPQVQTSPTCTVTGELMSATLAEAATQLSFASFLERCISVRAPPPPPLPIPTPLLDAGTQTVPRIAVSQLHLLRTVFSAPRVPDPSLRYFWTRLCRHLCTASLLTMPPHN